ncbi:hypothetical protein BaRGS_00009329, partial [Batillaria attramentaria]
HYCVSYPESTWRPKKVILLTYRRSGSSFTADVDHHSSDVCFISEPLRAFADLHEVPVAVSDSDSQSQFTDSAFSLNSATGSDANSSLAEPKPTYTRHFSDDWFKLHPWLVLRND